MPAINSFSYVLKQDQVEKIKQDLTGKGFKFKEIPYGYFQASLDSQNVNISIWHSLKCLVQGKGAEDFIRFYMEPEILKTFKLDYGHLEFSDKIGMDESGKGDYFGPLVVAAVHVKQANYKFFKSSGVMDSKKISDARIHVIADIISKHAKFKVLSLRPEKYNELYQKIGNLNILLSWAHATCLKNLLSESPAKHALCDQFSKGPHLENYIRKMGLKVDLEQRVRGEEDMAVAAASIIARAAFLNRLEEMSQATGLQLPKGAGPEVLKAGREFVRRFGKEKLGSVAKLHFKTTEDLEK